MVLLNLSHTEADSLEALFLLQQVRREVRPSLPVGRQLRWPQKSQVLRDLPGVAVRSLRLLPLLVWQM